jgi:hypothetical protein
VLVMFLNCTPRFVLESTTFTSSPATKVSVEKNNGYMAEHGGKKI